MTYKTHKISALKSSAAMLLTATLLGGIPVQSFAQSSNGFTSTDAEEEGYWYSRYNLGNLSMRSGLGNVVMPDKAVIMMAIAAVDADFNPAEMQAGNASYGDGDHVTLPQNVAPISTVYKSGDPHYITQFNPSDFGTQRWDQAKMDMTLTGLANGFTILKETEWARQFHVDDHFGTPDSDFGAYWRFVGMMMNMNAKMQTGSFLKNMSDYDLSNGGDSAMLMAVSDLADMLKVEQVAHSNVMNRYLDPETAAMFAQGADKLFEMVVESQPDSIRTASLAIQAMVWYGAKTENAENKARAMQRIPELVESLNNMSASSAAEQAYMLRGLIEAKRTLGINDGTIMAMGADLVDGFDMDTGSFTNQSLYTIDDVGAIMGALNALRTFETADVDADAVNDVFRVFWEHAVNISGMQISAPPIPGAKSPFEYEGEPPFFFRYDETQPMPPMAGGDFGVAPVFATSVEYSNGAWSVVDSNFDTAGAMHASNEMIWFHYDEINGFPEVDLSDIIK